MGKRKEVKAPSSKASSPPHVPDDTNPAPTLNQSERYKDIDALQVKIDHLQAEIDELERDRQEKMRLAVFGGRGWPKPIIDYKNAFNSLFITANWWADDYVKRDTAALAEFAPGEKRSILQSLDGYCVQDLDWDTFLKSLPYPIRTFIPLVLARTMLVKDIFDKFFENPFWYFEGKTEAIDVEPQAQSSLSFAQHLQHLYEQFLIVNPKSASLWKTETVRLANSVNDKQANNTEMGRHTKSRREELTRSFASAMLKHPPFQMLLENCEDTAVREEKLVQFYEKAEKLAISLGSSHGICTYRNLTKLASPLFSGGDQVVTAEDRHILLPHQPRLDGHRILFILQPAVSRTGAAILDGGLESWAQAVAVIEDGDCTEEVYHELQQEREAEAREVYREKQEVMAKHQAEWERERREKQKEGKRVEEETQGEEVGKIIEGSPGKQEDDEGADEDTERPAPKRARRTRGAAGKKSGQQVKEEKGEEETKKIRGRRATRGKTTK
ncbi:hypothetical protein ASPFODRAFT_216871 [Aspergillus luchuensis CBS 106.47]|uniref:Uncharacterized protein n=1 Tax=Aspergillus luchuensis (strain CBS 106.47) TaxID=1137211 RepID=A0A1M3TN25_ASPLC|nr:hypothetical protein ASPFODRAFT_216871 [Aspergillus luchuensis CBS 106.47]